MLESEAVLTSTHDVGYLEKKKKHNEYPCQPKFYSIKVGVRGSLIDGLVNVMPGTGGCGKEMCFVKAQPCT